MKRTELKRTGWQRKAPTNTDRKPRAAVKVKSDRRVSDDREYAALRREILKLDDPLAVVPCVAGPLLARLGITGCTHHATELHHKRKRSSAGALCNPANVIPTCHWCNVTGIEDYPMEAWRLGLVVRPGDSDWDALSSRAWRLR